jgi:DNA modification methylase
MDYKEDLKNKLPELKKIEGFPIGADEDILALSEPPYYTACPNPYISDFIKEHGKPYDEANDDYHREPFVGDVEEGKRHPIYMMHSYHTKVPHKAIIKYIEHFTDKGDLVLDAYSGSGMTGLAAQTLKRNAILIDLSPAACFLSFNNNFGIFNKKILNELREIINQVNEECSNLFVLPNGEVINYIIWSEIFICPFCGADLVFWDSYVDTQSEKVNDDGFCPSCDAKNISKRSLKKKIIDNKPYLYPVIVSTVKNKQKIKRRLSLSEANYLMDQEKNIVIPYKYPINLLPDGSNLSQPKKSNNFTTVDDFYFKSTLYVLSKFWDLAEKSKYPAFAKFFTTSFLGMRCTKRMPYRPKGLSAGAINNLSIPSIIQNYNPLSVALRKFTKNFLKAFNSEITQNNCIVSTQSATSLNNIESNTIDFIFTDPPFGSNIMYSDMNFIWEAWLGVITNDNKETIVNSFQNKRLIDYSELLSSTFREYFRVLKPKRWITVEFNNSQSSIWNSIREAITKSGFIISQVSILDKKLGSFKQVSSDASVDKDLIIFAFKPDIKFNNEFRSQHGLNLEMDFINQFLSNISPSSLSDRNTRVLYSKMVGFYLQNGYSINLDFNKFSALMNENFIFEDGLWFTHNQINSYIEYKKKMRLEGIKDIKLGSNPLFVSDEKSVIVWLYNFIDIPKNFSDISLAYNKLNFSHEDEIPDIRNVLEDNFVYDNGCFRKPHSINESNEINSRREKALLREFESLLIKAKTEKGKIKLVRKEALLFGFETCYKTRRYQDILTVTSKLDKAIIENSAELNDFVEAAEIMVKGME